MDRLGRQSVYIKDKRVAVELKKLSADTDVSMIELVQVALVHMFALARIAMARRSGLTITELQSLMAAAESMAFAYHAAEGNRKEQPVSTSL